MEHNYWPAGTLKPDRPKELREKTRVVIGHSSGKALILTSKQRRSRQLSRRARRAVLGIEAVIVLALLVGARMVTSTAIVPMKPVFATILPSPADGVPAYLAHVPTPSGMRDLIFITTRDGQLLALDAHTGTTVWGQQHGAGNCKINLGSATCYTTSSPVIDPNGQFVYTYGLDGKVHKHRVGNGAEVTGGGWPETVTLKPYNEKGSSGLSIATAKNGVSYLYVANGGYPGDRGDYQGHLTTINLRTGAQAVFNAECSNQTVHFVETPGKPDCPYVQSAIWARPGASYDPATNHIYVTSSNGLFKPAAHAWGDSVLALNPDGTGAHGNPLDSYTPADQAQLRDTDADLGSTGPVILPMPPSSRYKHVALQSGKDGLIRLLNLDNLSGKGMPGQTGGEIGPVIPVPQGGPVLTQPIVWTDPTNHNVWVFVADAGGISGLRLAIAGGIPRLLPVWKSTHGGTTPIIANGLLLYAGPSNLWALNPRTGAVVGHAAIGYIHWEYPLAVGNVVYIEDTDQRLAAFQIPSGV
jgi:outer membrane protein assembly factor BamB